MPIKLVNHPKLRTIRFIASGTLSLEDVAKAELDAKAMTDSYRGGKHMVLADMRGMKPSTSAVANKLGELIGYQRSHGVFRCVHISDETVTKLQMARLARSAQPSDTVTIDVVSMDEAELVLTEERLKLRSE